MNLQSAALRSVIATALLAGMGSASAQSAIDTRDSTYLISFPGSLENPTTQYFVTADLPAGGGNYSDATITYKTGNTGVFSIVTGSLTSNVPLLQGAGTTEFTATINNPSGSAGGKFEFGYSTLNGPNFTDSWTMSGVANGYKVDEFGGNSSAGIGGCGSNILSQGGTFSCEVSIVGDWTLGDHPGGVYLTGLNTGYTITNDFTYNAGLNQTEISVIDTNYNGTNPGLAFNLVIGAVPEPSTYAMFLAGLGMIGFVAFKRRRSNDRFAF